MRNIIFITSLVFIFTSCNFGNKKSDSQTELHTDTLKVDFWNGNRSEIRQDYEREVLEAILKVTSEKNGPYTIQENQTEYPGNEEAQVFSKKNHDLFVTIAGNQKFKEDDMIVISKPLAKNLLGYRIPIIRIEDSLKLNKKTKAELQKLTHGIPETWSDATIFRDNGFKVSEEGNFEDIFDRLKSDNFDYTTFGANEVQSIFKNRALKNKELLIEDDNIFFYAFPLVFYVHPNQSELAKRIGKGLTEIENNGALDSIFNAYYGNIIEELNLKDRQLILLNNPLIPEEFADLRPDLKFLDE